MNREVGIEFEMTGSVEAFFIVLAFQIHGNFRYFMGAPIVLLRRCAPPTCSVNSDLRYLAYVYRNYLTSPPFYDFLSHPIESGNPSSSCRRTHIMAPRTRTTRRGRQSQAATEKVVSENVHLNTIYRLLDTQIKKEQAFQATDDGEVDTRNVLLAGIDKGSENLCAAIDELLQDPFGDTRPGMVFNDNERRALRTFHNALTAEISTRSATTKDSLMTANKLLVEQFDPRPDETGRHTEWQPRRFRIVDPDDDGMEPVSSLC